MSQIISFRTWDGIVFSSTQLRRIEAIRTIEIAGAAFGSYWGWASPIYDKDFERAPP